MGIPIDEFHAMEMRVAANRLRGPAAAVIEFPKGEKVVVPVPLEAPLHQEVMDWCDSQQPWPWMYVHSRMDRKSTTHKGVPDFVIFGPFPLCLVLEGKARDEKQKPEQLLWAAKMKRIGWTVHMFRSMPEFLSIVAAVASPKQDPPAFRPEGS